MCIRDRRAAARVVVGHHPERPATKHPGPWHLRWSSCPPWLVPPAQRLHDWGQKAYYPTARAH
eukprot:6359405-Alexandrium_andersonii.AAC.1